MVSFWPFKGDDTSAAAFEKSLRDLSTKITKASSRNDAFRQRQRRFKALWTLYSSFAYILVALILVLVTGWQSWQAVEWSALAGGPVVVLGVRTAVDAYYNWRQARTQEYLNELYKQRRTQVDKLKAATKYNSTQQLLDKYGGEGGERRGDQAPQQMKGKNEGAQQQGSQDMQQQMQQHQTQHQQHHQQGTRTGFGPPPTANIPGRQPAPLPPVSPQSTQGQSAPQWTSAPQTPNNAMNKPLPPNPSEPSEEFAPNAFSNPPPPLHTPDPATSQYATESPKWYDRILDVVLGEDETNAKNRIALICKECRLVNGQAAPGVTTPEEIGRWRCSSCGAWNGVESEVGGMLKEMRGTSWAASTRSGARASGVGVDGADESEEDEDIVDPGAGEIKVAPPAGSTRSKARQRKKA